MGNATALADKLGYHPGVQSFIRAAASCAPSRRVLNAVYRRLTADQRLSFHRYFSRLFRNQSEPVSEGVWKVRFAGRTILLPLRSEQLWLEWDSAVSILGHDIEVKETYRVLLEAADRPELFIDVGANYGTHSLLFLVHGIDTLTFEPNSSCLAYFKTLCALNGVKPNLQPVAVGRSPGYAELAFPASETWLGSTDLNVARNLAQEHQLVTQRVEQTTLDAYLPQALTKRTLIKIDTEGNEIAVLGGATQMLQQVRPKVVFEARLGDERRPLFELLQRCGYQLHSLPIRRGPQRPALELEQFLAAAPTNFIALPA